MDKKSSLTTVQDIALKNSRALKKSIRKNICSELSAYELTQILKHENSVKGRLQRKLVEKGLQSPNSEIVYKNASTARIIGTKFTDFIDKKKSSYKTQAEKVKQITIPNAKLLKSNKK